MVYATQSLARSLPCLESRCRQGATTGGQSRDFWSSSRGSPASPLSYHSQLSFHLRLKNRLAVETVNLAGCRQIRVSSSSMSYVSLWC